MHLEGSPKLPLFKSPVTKSPAWAAANFPPPIRGGALIPVGQWFRGPFLGFPPAPGFAPETF